MATADAVRTDSGSSPTVGATRVGALPRTTEHAPMRPCVIHPLLFAVHPIVSLYAHNLTEASLGVVVLPIAVSVGLAGLVWCLGARLLRSWARAGVIVTAVWVAFFSYGHAYSLVETARITLLGLVIGTNKFLAPVFFLGLSGVVFLVVRHKGDAGGVTRVLNLVGACLLAWPSLMIGTHAMAGSSGSSDASSVGPTTDAGIHRVGTDRLPNIYYIVLDAYARADVLRDIYGHDNRPFLRHLRDRGFYVAQRSRSNYCRTFLSLTSSLNMQHVADLGVPVGPELSDRKPVIARLQDNLVFRRLRERGYKIASFATGST